MSVVSFIETKGRVLSPEERLEPSKTALVVVDVQNDFCSAEGVFGRLGHDVSMMPRMAERLGHLVEAARRKNVLIIWVRATYDEVATSAPLAETYNRREFTGSQCLEGSWGADWFDGLAPRNSPNEVIVTKHRFSAFWDTPIDLYLRSNAIRTVVVTGVVTSGCVESTVRDAMFRDYRCVLLADCMAEPIGSDFRRSNHEASLFVMQTQFAWLSDSGHFLQRLGRDMTRHVSKT